MSTVDIAFGVDGANLDQVAVVIRSVLQHSRDPGALRFHILTREAPAARERVAGWGLSHIRVVPVVQDLRRIRMSIAEATLLRLQIPAVLEGIDRVVYLDADVLVKTDIARLHGADLRGKPIGAVVDMHLYIAMRRQRIHWKRGLFDYLSSIGLDPSVPGYFNAGVLVMDLEALRRTRFVETAAALWEQRAEALRYHDQCVLNLVIGDNVTYLDPRWNVMAMAMRARHLHYAPATLAPQVRKQLDEQWIIHYTGPRKPWNDAEAWRGEEWWAVAEKSGLPWTRPAPLPISGFERARRWYLNLTQGLSVAAAKVSRS